MMADALDVVVFLCVGIFVGVAVNATNLLVSLTIASFLILGGITADLKAMWSLGGGVWIAFFVILFVYWRQRDRKDMGHPKGASESDRDHAASADGGKLD